MRGNEIQYQRHVPVEVETFPIPMRGNEPDTDHLDETRRTVPDPHEG